MTRDGSKLTCGQKEMKKIPFEPSPHIPHFGLLVFVSVRVEKW